jgi:hypothetical protein
MKMADDEAMMYDFCDELLRNHSVSDATYARALATIGEQGTSRRLPRSPTGQPMP